MISKENTQDIYRLSPLQEGMLFHSLYDQRKEAAYLVQNSYRLTGPLDPGAFEKGWRGLFARHEVFRTVIRYKKTPHPLALVLKRWDGDYGYHDLGALPRDRQEATLEEARRELRSRSLDLTTDPLFMVHLYRLDDDHHEVILTFHHIIMDAWSMDIVHNEFVTLYRTAVGDQCAPLPAPTPYGAYSGWLQKQDIPLAEEYWRRYLEGYEGVATVAPEPIIAPPPPSVMKEKSYHLTEETSRRLAAISTDSRLTLNNMVQAIWSLLLGRLNGRSDVVFGAVIAGRDDRIPNVERIVGPFINTLPVRARLDDERSFLDFARRIADGFSEAKLYQYYPLSQIQKAAGADETLFDHVLVFENIVDGETNHDIVHDDGRRLSMRGVEAFSYNHYPFSLNVSPGKRIGYRFSYDAALYTDAQIDRIFSRIEAIITSVVNNPQRLLGDVSYLGDEERRLLVDSFNQTATPFPEEATIADLFETTVARTPDAIALAIGDLRLTYRELDEQASAVAATLTGRYGVKSEDRVALLLDRSERMIVALLGVLKAGAAFVPVDPKYPASRIAYILDNCHASIILADDEHRALASETATEATALTVTDAIATGRAANEGGVVRSAHAKNLAYIIFTSGSTGNPKGVMIENRSVVNMALALARGFGVTTSSNVGQFASLAFDFSLSEIFMPLLTGARLTLIPKEIVDDISAFVAYLTDQKVTDIKLPPSYLSALNRAPLPTVTTITSAGETIKADDAFHYAVGRSLFNEYGPTECCVGTTIIRVTQAMKATGRIPIGRPIDNYRLYILDAHDRLAPLGVAGELCVAGAGVARGYFGDEELTARRFVPDPFHPGERMYRTGDTARWRPDGAVDYIGRVDFQVKVRGFRIEPGEIEAALLTHPDVAGAAVTVTVDAQGENMLVAYYTAANEGLTTAMVRDYLAETLPAHMIPASFHHLATFPLTPNGKIDRKALATMSVDADLLDDRYSPPANEMESQLTAIMAGVLNKERIGATCRFFEQGGNSITALMAVVRMQAEVSPDINLQAFFTHATARELATYVSGVHDYAVQFAEERPALFNADAAEKTLFLFPPPVGYGIAYGGLAAKIPDVRLVCLNFIEGDDRIDRYLATLREYQTDGPYVLGGFSSGGNVAFEVAKAAEAAGMRLGPLLLIDSWRKERPLTLDQNRKKKKLIDNLDVMLELVKKDKSLQTLDNTGYIEKHLRERIERYNETTATMVNGGTIESDIYLLASEAVDYDEAMAACVTRDWRSSTRGEFSVTQGFGNHDYMLDGEELSLNAGAINELLGLIFQSVVRR